MNENNEVLDLVDSNDVIVGTVRRGDMVSTGYSESSGYVRFAEAFVLNDKGQIWVPIRGMHKSIAPGGCDFSVAEHVLSGESYQDAVIRGLAEEADVVADPARIKHIGTLAPCPGKLFFDAVYAYELLGAERPTYSSQEFSSADWMSLEDLIAKVTSEPPTKSSLLPALKLLKNTR